MLQGGSRPTGGAGQLRRDRVVYHVAAFSLARSCSTCRQRRSKVSRRRWRVARWDLKPAHHLQVLISYSHHQVPICVHRAPSDFRTFIDHVRFMRGGTDGRCIILADLLSACTWMTHRAGARLAKLKSTEPHVQAFDACCQTFAYSGTSIAGLPRRSVMIGHALQRGCNVSKRAVSSSRQVSFCVLTSRAAAVFSQHRRKHALAARKTSCSRARTACAVSVMTRRLQWAVSLSPSCARRFETLSAYTTLMSYQVVAEAVLRRLLTHTRRCTLPCRMLCTLLCRHMMVERSHRVDGLALRDVAGEPCHSASCEVLLSSRCIAANEAADSVLLSGDVRVFVVKILRCYAAAFAQRAYTSLCWRARFRTAV
jgi:hypothetical protein